MKIDLYKYQDLEYKKFNDRIIVTKYPTIGIRVPTIRKVSKEINAEEFIKTYKLHYYEEMLLYIFCLSKIKDDNKIMTYVDNFMKYIDCWSLCDTLCSNLGFVKKDLDRYYDWINKYLNNDNEFYVRFALVMFLKYYKDGSYLSRILDGVKSIHIDKYYSNMAIAWLLCELYISYPKVISTFIISQNKEVQKMFNRKVKDSYRT